jgi:general secretion pathway protein A
MYKSFFGLKANPFNVNPDPRFLYVTKAIQEALACLTYGIQNRKGFVLLTGEVGTGKTTLINKLMGWVRAQRYSTAYIFNSKLTVPEFLDYMMADFGIPCETTEKSKVLQRLNHFLLDRYRSGGTAVLIVDEAQNLSPEVLEEIRLLTNLETSTEKLLQIVLSGQPELELKMKDPNLRQLRQRITLRCRTQPLTMEDTSNYISLRMRVAGASGEPAFTPDAVRAIYEYSSGIPRVINLLCEHAMISAFVDQTKPVTAEMVDIVAREFELDELGTRSPMYSSGNGDGSLVDALKALSNYKDRMNGMEAERAMKERKI